MDRLPERHVPGVAAGGGRLHRMGLHPAAAQPQGQARAECLQLSYVHYWPVCACNPAEEPCNAHSPALRLVPGPASRPSFDCPDPPAAGATSSTYVHVCVLDPDGFPTLLSSHATLTALPHAFSCRRRHFFEVVVISSWSVLAATA